MKGKKNKNTFYLMRGNDMQAKPAHTAVGKKRGPPPDL